MRAIKIDSFNHRVYEIEIADSDKEGQQLKDMQRAVDGYINTAFYFPGNTHLCMVNDESLIQNEPPKNFFVFRGYPQPLAGNALIVGTNKHGDTVPCTMALDDIIQCVGFVSLDFVREQIRQGNIDYNSYYVEPDGTRHVLKAIDLGAFDNE